tara:strand:+ start:507 stop:614 length:108 start_codon:yes stop_codon:yes gene_type:complete
VHRFTDAKTRAQYQRSARANGRTTSGEECVDFGGL